MSVSTTIHLQQCLERLSSQDAAAKSELLAFARRRLKQLADQMFHRFPQLYSREHSDDLFQEAMVRLWQSLEDVGPTTVPAFMGLAALQMRRALCDLARAQFGREGDSNVVGGRTVRVEFRDVIGTSESPTEDARNAPEELACWSEFHAAADKLPEPCRTAFDLLFYHEMPQSEVALLMNVSERQVRRYWHHARLKLSRILDDSWPDI
jgi:RNA polymerase sigma factor (sigma-70 family)